MSKSILVQYKETKAQKSKPFSVLDLNKKAKAPKVKTEGVLAKKKREKKPWTKKRIALTTTFAALGVAVVTLGTLVAVKTDWQMIADEMKASDYTPTAEIKEITETLRLTRKGKSIFYATHPKLLAANAFNTTCGSDGEKSSYILGCYYYDDDDEKREHLHIYDAAVKRLDENGVHYDFVTDRNITAMHEMLHAAYERLSDDQKVEMCGYARKIVDETDDLKSALNGYPEDQYCTEAFARIGSEYIVGYSGYKSDVVTTVERDKLSDIAKISADKLGKQYQKYFSYNYELFEARQQNINERVLLAAYIASRYTVVNNQRTSILGMINSYYAAPAAWKASYINEAITIYQNNLTSLKSYIATYQKIDNTLDSEVNSILTKLTQ